MCVCYVGWSTSKSTGKRARSIVTTLSLAKGHSTKCPPLNRPIVYPKIPTLFSRESALARGARQVPNPQLSYAANGYCAGFNQTEMGHLRNPWEKPQ